MAFALATFTVITLAGGWAVIGGKAVLAIAVA
jgi:hypothetical protein